MTLVLLLAPGILAAAYYCKLKKIAFRSIEFLIFSILFILLINLFCLSVVYLRGHKNVPTNEIFTILGNAVRYGLMAMVAGVAFPNIFMLLGKIHFGKRS